MPKTKPQQAGKASTQEVICRALAQAGGSATREALATASGIDARALQNAIYNACQAKRVRRTGDQIELTPAGKKWIGESTATTTQPSPKRAHKKAAKPKQRKTPVAKARTAKPVGAEPPIERIAVSSCKCAAFSDGSFVLEKDGATIALTADEYQAMCAYQQRMQPADGMRCAMEPIVPIESIKRMAEERAAQYSDVNDACPYPFFTGAGRLFKQFFLQARGKLKPNTQEQA